MTGHKIALRKGWRNHHARMAESQDLSIHPVAAQTRLITDRHRLGSTQTHERTRYVIDTSRQGPVAVLTLNRPERRNALGTEGMRALDAALRGAERDAAMRAVVPRGAPPAFCAGGAFCQLDSGYCELVKRLRDPSLSSPPFKRIAEIAVSEPNLLATRLAEAGVEPRLALAIAAALMRERKDPPVCCKVCRATAACASTARARAHAGGPVDAVMGLQRRC